MENPGTAAADLIRSMRDGFLVAVEVAKKEVADAKARLADAEANLEASERLLPQAEGRTGPRMGGAGIHAHIRPSQLLGCRTQRDAWREIAALSGGLVRPTDSAQLLIDANITDRDYETVRGNGLSWMTSAQEWERVEGQDGTYRHLGPDGMGAFHESDEGERQWPTDQWPAERSQTDDGVESRPISPVNREIEGETR